MHEKAARQLIEDTFNQPYSHDRFKKFIHELTKSYEERNTSGQIPDNFKDSIKSVYRIGKFVDSSKNEIDILAVTLTKDTSLDRARTLQRNFIARHLSVRQKEAALVAFIAPDSQSWRFSLVRRELGITLNLKGKAKAATDFSPARRFSFLVGKGERTHTVKRQLFKFFTTDDKPTLKTLENAFNIETVTDEFFREYRELFNNVHGTVVQYLEEHSDIKAHFAEKDIEASDFAKRLLGQIVFLYFLQKKGWLGVPRNGEWGEGSRSFLRDLYNRSGKENKNFFDKYLKHLFYEALNRDHSDNDHYHSLFDSRIPFLNGGLFEPYHDYDWSRWDIELPNSLFHNPGQSLFGDDGNGILDVFDRYNFTVAEDEPLEREVAIDPEMLGKVFENLLEVKDRKAKGTYYTPREIVHYMCQESLIAYLAAKLPALDKEELDDFIRYGDVMLEHDVKVLNDPTPTYKNCFLGDTIRNNLAMVDTALAVVKVCDPAIGSGAFPVGMMTEIVRARKVLALHMRQEAKPYELKRQTIQDCLYGVDLDPGAIEIAKLRLWLSLVVDEDNFREIQALPNLDYKIMQGNSLLQTFEGIKLFDDSLLQKFDTNIRRKRQLEEDMRDLQGRLMMMLTRSAGVANPKDKKALEKAIQQKQKEIDILTSPDATAKVDVPLLSKHASAFGLSEQLKDLHVRFFQVAQPAAKKRLKAEIEELEERLIETSLKELHQNNAAPLLENIRSLHRANVKPYFLWKLHFSEVFAGENAGFDIVIANPPYISIEKFSGTTEQKSWKESFNVFASRGDIYCLFYEQGVNILKQEGQLCFIAPNRFFKSGYGKNLREFLALNTRLLKILDFGELPVFDAGTDPSILLIQKAPPALELIFASIKRKEDIQDLVTYIAKASQSIAISDLSASGWNFGDSNDRSLLQKIIEAGTPLGEFVNGNFYYGIKTGLNEAFVIDSETRARLIAEDPKCTEIIMPWLRGRDVHRWSYSIQELYVILVKYNCGKDLHKYPSIVRHLSGFEKALRQRGQCEGTKDKPGTKQHHWLELDNNPGDEYISQFTSSKIVYADIAKHMRAAYDRKGCFVGNTMYVIPTNDLSILGILNSKIFDWFARHKFQPLGDPWNGGRMRFIAQFMKTFPMPKSGNREMLAQKVKSVLDKKERDAEANVTTLEQEINQEVYRLYNLTPGEIALVEAATLNAQKRAN